MRLTCPKCDASLRLAEEPDDDTPIQCPDCRKTFYAQDVEDDEPRPVKKTGKKRKRQDDDEDEPEKKFPVVPVVAGSIAVLAIVGVAIGVLIASRPNAK